MTQSTNRNSLLDWMKNLKRNTLLNDSVNEIEESEDISTLSLRSPTHQTFLASSHPLPLAFPSLVPREITGWTSSSANPDLLRPLLSHKSRSTNNVHRERSPSTTTGSPLPENSFHEIRQHRDSFLQNNLLIEKNSQYFGVALEQAINQAAAKISILGSSSTSGNDDQVMHYGRIPIVVAKCGVYLKSSGLNVEGIFRVAGSSKRIKELQIIFNTPPSFGKKLDWEGFTVHDAASVLRRYLNALPEPLIVLDLYDDFRDTLRIKPRIIKYMKYRAENPWDSHADAFPLKPTSRAEQRPQAEQQPQNQQSAQYEKNVQENEKLKPDNNTKLVDEVVPPALDPPSPTKGTAQENDHSAQTERDGLKSYRKLGRDICTAIGEYKELLDQLPSLSKQLLFYILDLLAMVQNYSLENLMSARNLAAIFQPSILLHPDHDMYPEEYALSQAVVEFLIQYAYKVLPNSEQTSISGCVSVTAKLAPTPREASLQVNFADTSLFGIERHHSKSFSTNPEDFEMIGFKNASLALQPLVVPDAALPGAASDEDNPQKATNPYLLLRAMKQHIRHS